MVWSARLWFVAFFAAWQLAFTGCGPSFPRVVPQASPSFMGKSHRISTVDVLPLDIQLWTYQGNKVPPEQLGQSLSASTSSAVLAELAGRGYDVVARMDWNGAYTTPGGQVAQAMEPEALDGTLYALSTYDQAVAQSRDRLVTPYLPALLGQSTGSDATLYVGGWSYVGDDGKHSTASKIAMGVVIGIFVITFAVVILAATKGKAATGSKGGSSAGRVASGASRVGSGVGRIGSGVGRAAGRVTGSVLRSVVYNGPRVLHGMSHMADAFGRTDTHITVAPGRPDYYGEDRAPRRGRSQMYLRMTLVDNHTGGVLWHASQRFPANGARSDHVRKAVGLMLEQLPGY